MECVKISGPGPKGQTFQGMPVASRLRQRLAKGNVLGRIIEKHGLS